MRLTLLEVKNSSIPRTVGLAKCSTEFLDLVNEAQQRLVMGPELFWETYQRYRFTVTNGHITMPRGVASIISIAVDCQPAVIRNEWFEFLESGYGIRSGSSGCEGQIIDRGTSPVFLDINSDGNRKKLRVQSDVTEGTGKRIGLLGYDWEGEWIRTVDGGTWVDGDWLSIPPTSATVTTTSQDYRAITGVIIPTTTVGDIKLYEYDTVLGTTRKIGHYESGESVPSYRRYLLPGVGCDTGCKTITAMVKREFIPLRSDNDILIIGSLPALKEMCMAVQKRERSNIDEANVYEANAFRILDREAAHYISRGTVAPLRIEGGETWGVGGTTYVQ